MLTIFTLVLENLRLLNKGYFQVKKTWLVIWLRFILWTDYVFGVFLLGNLVGKVLLGILLGKSKNKVYGTRKNTILPFYATHIFQPLI